jgi:hypothetical protein
MLLKVNIGKVKQELWFGILDCLPTDVLIIATDAIHRLGMKIDFSEARLTFNSGDSVVPLRFTAEQLNMSLSHPLFMAEDDIEIPPMHHVNLEVK